MRVWMRLMPPAGAGDRPRDVGEVEVPVMPRVGDQIDLQIDPSGVADIGEGVYLGVVDVVHLPAARVESDRHAAVGLPFVRVRSVNPLHAILDSAERMVEQ